MNGTSTLTHGRTSPLQVSIVLHAYAVMEPFEMSGIITAKPFVQKLIAKFVELDVLVRDTERPCGYRLGGRGARWVYDILRTSP